MVETTRIDSRTRSPIGSVWRSRSLLYPLVGIGLALGSPLGLLLVRWLVAGFPLEGWLLAELVRLDEVYVYVTVSTSAVFALVGWRLGLKTDALNRASFIDPLTQLPNRRWLDAQIQEELARYRRYGQVFSVLLVDVDRLKEINDVQGHGAGDAALSGVARALRRACRAVDIPARYGGDEFSVLAPETAWHDALELGERLRRALPEAGRQHGLDELTVSVGVADIATVASDSQHALFQAADEALYVAKREGRNRVRAAATAPERDDTSRVQQQPSEPPSDATRPAGD